MTTSDRFSNKIRHVPTGACPRSDVHTVAECKDNITSVGKHFKARIEFPAGNFYAIEVYMRADNIIEAGSLLINCFGPLGIEPKNVVRLSETNDY